MIAWLIAVAVCVSIWGLLWNSNTKFAFGVLPGVFIGWLLSLVLPNLLTTETTGMHEELIPVWLPPLPLALIALGLFVWGVMIWVRAGKSSD